MAYVYDNKTYRNLQQQVKENMDNIAELQDLKLVGISVAGIVPDYSSLPSSAEQGQVYAVGSASPYELYVYNNSSWVDFGEFPKAGPQGEQGPQGEPGRQGPRGLTGPQGPKGYTGAPGIPGPVGPKGDKGSKGDKGDKGDPGLVDAFAKDAASVTAVGQAYIGTNGYLQVCTSLSPLTFEEGGIIRGPMGPRGIQGAKGETGPQGPEGQQGPEGPQGIMGPEGPQGPIGPEGPKGDKGDTGERGPEGPQGPKGDPGESASIKVNGNTYTKDASGLITLPDYPTTTSELTNDSGFITDASFTNYLEKDTFKPISWVSTDSNDSNITYKLKLDADANHNNQYILELAKYDGGSIKNYLDIDHYGIILKENATTANTSILSKGFLTLSDMFQTTTFFTNHISIDGTKEIPYNDIATVSQIPTKTSQLTNDNNFVTSEALSGYATEAWVEQKGYLTSVAWKDITDKPLLNYKSDIIQDSSNVIKTVYGGSCVTFKNDGNPGSIIGNTIDLSLPTLTWGTYGAYEEYAYNANPDTVEACYKCWRAYIDEHNLNVSDIINLKLSYTDSNGSTITATGTGAINSNSLIDPTLPKHQIRLQNVTFSTLNISNVDFRIQPQYGQIFIACSQLLDSSSQPITNITISIDITEVSIYHTINSSFIDTDIARVSNIPTTTSQLTNDSNFITNEALTDYATKTWVGQQGYLTSVAWGDITGKPTFATVATSGSYNDLTSKPDLSIYALSSNLATVATSGSYNDLSDKPTIPTTTSQLTNDSGFITSTALSGYATETWVGNQDYQDAYQVSLEVSRAISNQTKETWTFTLSDGSTVTKSIVLGE